MRTVEKQLRLLVMAVLFAAALGVLVTVGGDSAVADPAVPNPGHSYSEVELPVGTWSGLDADLLDGLNSDQIQDADDYVSSAGTVSRLGFSTATMESAGARSSVAVGADGLPVISYWGYEEIKVAHCGNAACSAGNTITTVASVGAFVRYTSVTVGADDLPIISYQNGGVQVVHCGNALCNSGNTITTVDATTIFGQWTSVTVGADGLPVVSYDDDVNEDLKVAHCGNADCSAGNTVTTVDSAGSVGLFPSVTVGADGLPVISYYDVTNQDLKVAHCGSLDCTSGNTITTVDSTGDVGVTASVTVGADGLPVISYFDQTNSDLKVAHCGNAACSAGNTITTVDSSGDVGVHTSVTAGADGLPVISYIDYANYDLKVAHCGNAACTSSTTATVDRGDFEPTSVTVGVDGLPVISYYYGGPKVAHCSNRFCVPYHRPR